MIRINLLPDEYRRRARTPIRLLAATLAAVTVTTSLFAYWTWLAFGVAAEVETRRSTLELEMMGLRPQVAYHDALQAETAVHASRETTLAQITQNRVLWTQQVDALIDVVAAGRDGARHFVWLDDLKVDLQNPTGSRARTQDFGSMKAKAVSGSPEAAQATIFIDDLEDREVSSIPTTFRRPVFPSFTKNNPDETLIPAVTIDFQVDLPILSITERTQPEPEEAL